MSSPRIENAATLKILQQAIEDNRQNPEFVASLARTFPQGEAAGLQDFVEVLESAHVRPSGRPGDHTLQTIPLLLTAVVNKDPQQSNSANEIFVGHMAALAADPSKSADFEARFKKVLVAGLLDLMGLQDTNQNYHTILHALEMQMDSQLKMQTIVDTKSAAAPNSQWAKLQGPTAPSPISLVTAGLAAFHDIVQNQGQFVNEKKSAESFTHHYQAEFSRDQQPEQIAALSEVAKTVIIKGTTLNMTFAPNGKHESLLSVESKLLHKFNKTTLDKENSADEVIKAMGAVLATNDIQRSSSKSALNYALSEAGKMPPDLEKNLHAALCDALQKAPFNLPAATMDEKNNLNALVNAALPMFKILIGQNIRMMADGPFRKFVDQDASMVGLMRLQDAARVANNSPAAREAYQVEVNNFFTNKHAAKIIDSLGGEAAFNKNMDNLEIVKLHQQAGDPEMLKIFNDDILHFNAERFPSLQGQGVDNACDLHGKLLLPALKQILTGPDQGAKQNVMAAIIFSAANQHGLDELAKQPELMQKAFATYGVEIANDMTPSAARVLASALVSLQLDPQVKQSVGNLPELKIAAENKIASQAEAANIPLIALLSPINTPAASPAASSAGSSPSDSDDFEFDFTWDPRNAGLLAEIPEYMAPALQSLQQVRAEIAPEIAQEEVKHSVQLGRG